MEILEPDNQQYQRVQPSIQTGPFVNFIMKVSGGKIKDEKTVMRILISIILIIVCATIVVTLKSIVFPTYEGIEAASDHHIRK